MATPLMGKLFFAIPAKPIMGKLENALSDKWGNFPILYSLQMSNNIPILKGRLETSSKRNPYTMFVVKLDF